MQTREQIYAEGVYQLIIRVSAQNEVEQKKYGSFAHKLPVLIRTAGLMQALAFASTRDEQRKRVLTDLATVLHFSSDTGLLERVRMADIDEYMYLTHEALHALLWFKRLAQSVLDVDASDEGDAE